ncbi:hypothetical protein A2T82_36055 (plasmid) [Burkholderia cenocepacia]|nr:hypothetical protein A2T82_36055 [Burkholderia cenocepacia]
MTDKCIAEEACLWQAVVLREGFASSIHHQRISACIDLMIGQIGEVHRNHFVDESGASGPVRFIAGQYRNEPNTIMILPPT